MKKILTHNESMHADEVMATAILKLWARLNNEELLIIRSRDEAEINSADIVYDVGGVYDSIKNRFDHHQKEGAGQRSSGTPYASAGLIWKHFGLALTKNNFDVWQKIDEILIEPIDANDNGINFYKSEKIEPVTINTIINSFNTNWDEDNQKQDQNFFEIVEFCTTLLEKFITKAFSQEKAKNNVLEALSKRQQKEILVLDNDYGYFDFADNYPEILYVIYPKKTNHTWRIKALNENKNSFIPKKPFPENWRGQNQADLKLITGENDIVFCHRAGFLCTTLSLEGAIKIARKSIDS